VIRKTTFSAIDFESAGTAPGKTDAPVQIGTTTWNLNLGITDTWTSYIHTDQPITWSAQKIHGITKKHLEQAPKLMLLWPKIKQRLNQKPVVAHGHGTEKRFLRAFPAHGFSPWIDTLQLSRAAWPDLSSHSLSALCDSLNLTQSVRKLIPQHTWHHALFDATASIILLEKIILTFQLEDSPLSTLLSPDTSIWKNKRRS